MPEENNASGYSRQDAMDNGIDNMVETVFVEKAMSPNRAVELFSDFITDGLQSSGYSDILTEDERSRMKQHAEYMMMRHPDWKES